MIKVEIVESPYGGYLFIPVSQKLRKKIRDHLADWEINSDGSIYLSDGEANSIISDLSPSQQRDLEGGWGLTVLWDPWDFLHLVGYDAHEAISY